MIKQFILPLLAVLLLGSCANKFSLVKRKYNKGYHFAASKNNHNVKKSEQAKDIAVQPVPSKVASLPPSSEREIIASEDFNVKPIGIADGTKSLTKSKNKKDLKAGSENESDFISTTKSASSLNKANAEDITSSKAGAASTNKILIIILALFPVICLIAMYLHDGNKITLNFWVALLLHLTVILWVIFTLLVAFDVIDLS